MSYPENNQFKEKVQSFEKVNIPLISVPINSFQSI